MFDGCTCVFIFWNAKAHASNRLCLFREDKISLTILEQRLIAHCMAIRCQRISNFERLRRKDERHPRKWTKIKWTGIRDMWFVARADGNESLFRLNSKLSLHLSYEHWHRSIASIWSAAKWLIIFYKDDAFQVIWRK